MEDDTIDTPQQPSPSVTEEVDKENDLTTTTTTPEPEDNSPVDESLAPSIPPVGISPDNSPKPEKKDLDSTDKVSADKEKINIRLNPVGNAPILKQKLWAVPADREVGQIIEFVKKYLKLEKHQSLFLFVNQAFAPSPDQPLKELYECFGSDGKIVLHYSTTYAWG